MLILTARFYSAFNCKVVYLFRQGSVWLICSKWKKKVEMLISGQFLCVSSIKGSPLYDPDNELSVGKMLAIAIDELSTKITVPYGTELCL